MKHHTGLLLFLLFAIVIAVMPVQASAKTVVDQLKRRVVVPDKPLRVISLAPSITEILFFLELGDRLKGATRFSDYPKQAAVLPKVGSYVNLDLEKIVSLKPDLCIAVKDGNPIEVVRRLELLDIPVYAVDPRDLDTLVETVLEIGHLLNVDTIAQRVTKDMVARIQRIKTLTAQVVHRPGVFFQIGISPIVSVGANTFNDELIQRAGGRNLVKGPAAYPRFSREQVLALAPEIIIICSMARQGGFERMKAEWNRWPSLPAVKNQQIYLVDSNLFNRATPRLVDGLELLFQLIHPEIGEGR